MSYGQLLVFVLIYFPLTLIGMACMVWLVVVVCERIERVR